MNRYFKNFILCGDIEHYCLLCREVFRDISSVERHIRWEKHRKSILTLKNERYFSMYSKNFIYKVANHCYCEICNVVFSRGAAIHDHVNNERHIATKNNLNNSKTETKNFTGRYDCGYIVINRVIINMAQWNSIIDEKCLLCNTSVPNIMKHLELEEHIINLIQSETKYEDERYYRKINDDTYHCFSCKKVYSTENFNNHWSTCENINEIEKQQLLERQRSTSSKTMEDATKLANFQKQLINTLEEFFFIDEEKNLATCKYCSTAVTINFNSMIEHLKNQHDNQDSKEPTANPEAKDSDQKSEQASEQKTDDFNKRVQDYLKLEDAIDHGKQRSELSKYGKEHSIKLNHNGSKGWCLLCDRYLPAHKKNFMEHIKGAHHRGNLDLQNPKKCDPTSRLYIRKSVLQCILKYAPQDKEIMINDKYSIDVYSFFLLHRIQKDPHFKKTKCFACNELFPQTQEWEHCGTLKHKNNFMAAKFMQTKEGSDLYTREIRPGFFHCGFCNQTFPSIDLLYHHVMSLNHLILQKHKTELLDPTVNIDTKSDDLYKILLFCIFENAFAEKMKYQ